ncbi:MAG TPA: hypothetical protein VGJ51_11090 [Candidatus Angelobacter sp.]
MIADIAGIAGIAVIAVIAVIAGIARDRKAKPYRGLTRINADLNRIGEG